MDPSEQVDRRMRPRVKEVRGPLSPRKRRLARWMTNGHVWVGVVLSAMLLVLAVTGIMLNHKQVLGLMPDVDHQATGVLDESMPIAELVRLAGVAAPSADAAGVDRLDVRPRDGLMKVRFRDDVVTEVTIDIVSGQILNVGERNDAFLEKLHSGEIFGDNGILLSDFAAVGLVLLIISGYWLWLFPRSRQ